MLKNTQKSLEAFSFWRNLEKKKKKNLVLTKMGLQSKPKNFSTLFSHNPYRPPLYLLCSPFMDMVISHVPLKFPTRRACTSFVSSKFAMSARKHGRDWKGAALEFDVGP